MKIVITGGHHTSALPVIELLQKQNNIKLYWYGHKHSLRGDTNLTLEYIEITSLGIPFYELHAGKFFKTYNLKRLAKIPLGFFQALFLLVKHKPDLIVSFGGYLAVPVVLAGYLLRIPSITHEQTVVLGWANKVISRFAQKVLITWPSSAKFFPKEKVVLTGIPVRKEVFNAISNSFKAENDLPTIYITGGKTGAHKINESIMACMEKLLTIANVIHQSGDYSVTQDHLRLKDKYDTLKDKVAGKYFLRKFVLNNEIGEAFLMADLVVARSGAHIVSELIALKKPSLLIPIPWVSHNEQYKNALVLKDAGLSLILEEHALTSETLFDNISYMLSELPNFRNASLENFVLQDSAQLIVNEILNYKTAS